MGLRAFLQGCGKSRPPTGLDLRTVQPVASRNTEYAIPVPFDTCGYFLGVKRLGHRVNHSSRSSSEDKNEWS